MCFSISKLLEIVTFCDIGNYKNAINECVCVCVKSVTYLTFIMQRKLLGELLGRFGEVYLAF